MSGKFSSALVLVSLAAIALATHRAEESGSVRGPGSVASDKAVVLGAFRAPSLIHTEKMQGPLTVTLSSPDPGASTFKLVGTLSTRKDLGEVEYSWQIPDGVELIQGQAQGAVTSLKAGEPTTIEATFHQSAAGNLQIHLIAKSTRTGGARFAHVAQFNTGVAAPASASVHSLTVYH